MQQFEKKILNAQGNQDIPLNNITDEITDSVPVCEKSIYEN
jgi:hypothetical protein